MSAPDGHLFQNTAKFCGRGVSRCCQPSQFLALLNLNILAAILCRHADCEIFCRLSLFGAQSGCATYITTSHLVHMLWLLKNGHIT